MTASGASCRVFCANHKNSGRGCSQVAAAQSQLREMRICKPTATVPGQLTAAEGQTVNPPSPATKRKLVLSLDRAHRRKCRQRLRSSKCAAGLANSSRKRCTVQAKSVENAEEAGRHLAGVGCCQLRRHVWVARPCARRLVQLDAALQHITIGSTVTGLTSTSVQDHCLLSKTRSSLGCYSYFPSSLRMIS